jgi:hypothetical protein
MDNIWENRKKILSGIKNLLLKEKYIEEIAAARQEICDSCEFKSKECAALISECCSVCGCSLKFKTRYK